MDTPIQSNTRGIKPCGFEAAFSLPPSLFEGFCTHYFLPPVGVIFRHGCGNIGSPFANYCDDGSVDFFVLEISSFQSVSFHEKNSGDLKGLLNNFAGFGWLPG